tara:strand:- start:273 stop:533 length:261 start_codon:yes stop_codon:yes gene_type:complete
VDNHYRKKILGYRELSQKEVDLMNETKALAEKLRVNIEKISNLSTRDGHITVTQVLESERCLNEAKTFLQTGIMWLARSVALPKTF